MHTGAQISTQGPTLICANTIEVVKNFAFIKNVAVKRFHCIWIGVNTFLMISEISSKSTKTLAFLRRNLAFAPKSTKEVVYKTLFCLNWNMQHPLGGQIEKVQRMAAC